MIEKSQLINYTKNSLYYLGENNNYCMEYELGSFENNIFKLFGIRMRTHATRYDSM